MSVGLRREVRSAGAPPLRRGLSAVLTVCDELSIEQEIGRGGVYHGSQ
jgi:hypothetical protein